MQRLAYVGSGLLGGILLTLATVTAIDLVSRTATPELVSERCPPGMDDSGFMDAAGYYCVQLRDDGSAHGELWVTYQQGGSDTGRHTVFGSPFTDLESDEAADLDVAWEDDGTIVVSGSNGARLSIPPAAYEVS